MPFFSTCPLRTAARWTIQMLFKHSISWCITCGGFVLNLLLVSSWNYHPCCVFHFIETGTWLHSCSSVKLITGQNSIFPSFCYVSEIFYVLCGTGVYFQSTWKLKKPSFFMKPQSSKSLATNLNWFSLVSILTEYFPKIHLKIALLYTEVFLVFQLKYCANCFPVYTCMLNMSPISPFLMYSQHSNCFIKALLYFTKWMEDLSFDCYALLHCHKKMLL